MDDSEAGQKVFFAHINPVSAEGSEGGYKASLPLGAGARNIYSQGDKRRSGLQSVQNASLKVSPTLTKIY